MKKSLTCLLPFYNEGQRVLRVLAAVTQVEDLVEIVAVDDGSTDGVAELIKAKFPQVKLVRSEQNLGKAGAVALGLKEVKSEYVFLCDADLKNLQAAEIELGWEKIRQTPVEMIIFNRVEPNERYQFTSNVMSKTGIACLFSGDRILQTEDLRQVLAQEPENYQLEAAINHYMIKHEKKVGWIESSAKNHYRYQELGLFKTFLKYWRMMLSILRWIGPAGLIYQLVGWELEEV